MRSCEALEGLLKRALSGKTRGKRWMMRIVMRMLRVKRLGSSWRTAERPRLRMMRIV